MSFLNSLKSIALSAGKRVGRQVLNDVIDSATKIITGSASSRRNSARAPKKTSTTGKPAKNQKIGTRKGGAASPGFPGKNDNAIEYNVALYGLPDFEYRPQNDDAPDPGEVVWTWVPYEENNGQGKDRPVLVLADLDEHVIFAQITSQDHDVDADQEARWNRYWMDIGSGAWDSKGRPSEVRINRLMIVHQDKIRREGAQLDKSIFNDVVKTITEFYTNQTH